MERSRIRSRSLNWSFIVPADKDSAGGDDSACERSCAARALRKNQSRGDREECDENADSIEATNVRRDQQREQRAETADRGEENPEDGQRAKCCDHRKARAISEETESDRRDETKTSERT